MSNLFKSTPKQKEQQFIKSLEKEFARFLRPAPQEKPSNKMSQSGLRNNESSGINTRQQNGMSKFSNNTKKYNPGTSTPVISSPQSTASSSSIPNNTPPPSSVLGDLSNRNNSISTSGMGDSYQQEGRNVISPTPPVSIGISELEKIINELSDMVVTTYTFDGEGNTTKTKECFSKDGKVDTKCKTPIQTNTSDTITWLTKELEPILKSKDPDEQSQKIDEFADTIKNKLSDDNQETKTTLTNILTSLNGKKNTLGNQTSPENQTANIDILVKIITAVLNKVLELP